MYCDLLQTQEQRREALYRSHRFVCTCDFCLAPATSIQTKNSNHNRVFIKQIIEKLADPSNVEKVDINDMRKAILMSEQEALICSKAQLLYVGGASLLVRSREEAREGLQWLHQAKILYGMLEGKDSYHVEEIKHYIG